MGFQKLGERLVCSSLSHLLCPLNFCYNTSYIYSYITKVVSDILEQIICYIGIRSYIIFFCFFFKEEEEEQFVEVGSFVNKTNQFLLVVLTQKRRSVFFFTAILSLSSHHTQKSFSVFLFILSSYTKLYTKRKGWVYYYISNII